METLRGKTLFITGGSRGIGLAIALKAASEGANIAIAAKTVEANPKLPGTIYTAAAEVEAAGGKALPLQADIRDEGQVSNAVQQTVATFGGIDILVNNASAINLSGTLETAMKRYDLMQQVNTRGTFVVSQACLPHLLQAPNPHILTLSPPLAMQPKWFAPHLAYTLAKYGMSMCVLGMAEEFRGRVAVNALWPRTVILTAAIQMLGGRVRPEMCRKPAIVADAACWILKQDARQHTGHFHIDEEVLRIAGVTDLSAYAVSPDSTLITDLFLDS
ncbi:NAD(P)-dependent oxidoreductase [Candidatus Thiothrix sp. Deng01]|uniref:NAD(P)-dependent oxidoreductase n=1 Tax=Candidatus Thiothrix phosphatis TaxID=3112415 RepID=A0ABU6CX78_9GAMM|nr:NAD(P)-dependent oxidoreductase [Candidatus Thiothrix sp. Deng01]MEB4591421.1 NAD(P)-dependent oxidoreductase [Candidatus Thiothrix sp. Deng01]